MTELAKKRNLIAGEAVTKFEFEYNTCPFIIFDLYPRDFEDFEAVHTIIVQDEDASAQKWSGGSRVF